jgi:hypothetical protein
MAKVIAKRTDTPTDQYKVGKTYTLEATWKEDQTIVITTRGVDEVLSECDFFADWYVIECKDNDISLVACLYQGAGDPFLRMQMGPDTKYEVENGIPMAWNPTGKEEEMQSITRPNRVP